MYGGRFGLRVFCIECVCVLGVYVCWVCMCVGCVCVLGVCACFAVQYAVIAISITIRGCLAGTRPPAKTMQLHTLSMFRLCHGCTTPTTQATMDWESQDDGVVAKWLVQEGARDITVGTPVLVMVDSKEDVSAFADFTAASAGTAAAPPPKAAAPQAKAPAPAPAAAAPKAPVSKPAPRAVPGGRVVASPLAKKMALEAGVGLAGVAGSGPGGRIVAADVERLIASGGAAPASAPAAAASGPFVDIVNSNIRKVRSRHCLLGGCVVYLLGGRTGGFCSGSSCLQNTITVF